MDRMKAAKFGVILFGMGLTMTRGKHLNSEALLSLARDMNAYTRFVAKPMRGHGNVTGADNVVTWQTGYPFGVNMSRGYPRFNPGEYTSSDTLARGEADAALLIACDPMGNFSQPARERLKSIPLHRARSQGHADDPCGNGRVHHRHLRHQHARHRVSHGRRPDCPASGVSLAPSERLRRALRDPATSDRTRTVLVTRTQQEALLVQPIRGTQSACHEQRVCHGGGGCCLRPASRCERRAPRYLDPRRQDCRPTVGSGRSPGQDDRRLGPGRHAGRCRYALSHRRTEGERGPQDAARGQTQSGKDRSNGGHPQRHDGQRPEHVCHWLQVRGHGVYHRLRRRDPAAGRAPCP